MLRCFPKIVYNLFRTRRTRKNNFQEQPRPGSGRKTGSDLGRHLRIDRFRLLGCRDFRKPHPLCVNCRSGEERSGDETNRVVLLRVQGSHSPKKSIRSAPTYFFVVVRCYSCRDFFSVGIFCRDFPIYPFLHAIVVSTEKQTNKCCLKCCYWYIRSR